MNADNESAPSDAARQRRVELARQAFKDFYAQCFWSCDPNLVVTEQHIPFIIRELRHYGGHRGYRMVADICR